MTKPNLRGCLVSLAAGLVVLYVGFVGTFWMFGEAGPVYLFVLNSTDEPITVTFPPSTLALSVGAEGGGMQSINDYYKDTNLLYYLLPFLPQRPAPVPPWLDRVSISDAGGTEVWSGDLRDRPDLWDRSAWQMTVYEDGGEWAVRMSFED